MKKLTIIFLALFMVFSLGACAGNSQSSKDNTSDTVIGTDAKKQEAEETSEADDTKTEESGNESGQQNEATSPENDAAVGAGETADGAKVLVAYFSATNTTEGVAENLADGIGADLYEIVPKEPYTDADLDYHDNNSRTTIEMDDPDVRPPISGSVENMEQYDVVFLGYPIWWGEAPRIINTFVESYDFSGKTIVPFCTSGGSGLGSSATNLHSAAGGATWLDGQRFSGSASVYELTEWANGLGLDLSMEK